jgi:hypothetical protein
MFFLIRGGDVLFGVCLAGFALNVADGAALLLGFHIADEIVRRASPLAHGLSLIGSAVLWEVYSL